MPWAFIVLFYFAVLLSHGCSIDIELNEVSFLLGISCSCLGYILYLSSQGTGQVTTTTRQISRRLLAVSPDTTKICQLQQCVRQVRIMYKSTLMILWRKLFSLNICWDFIFLVKVTNKRDMGSTLVCSLSGLWMTVNLSHIDDDEA
jgi:hypothetical protein